MWVSHVTHVGDSCHPHKDGKLCTEQVCKHMYTDVTNKCIQMWVSHVTHMDESRHTYKDGKPCIEQVSFLAYVQKKNTYICV